MGNVLLVLHQSERLKLNEKHTRFLLFVGSASLFGDVPDAYASSSRFTKNLCNSSYCIDLATQEH